MILTAQGFTKLLASPQRTALVLGLFACAYAGTPLAPDRRVVDRVFAGDEPSEMEHGYVGRDAFAGVANGKVFRQARGFMRYALSTFDDSEVTLNFTFVAGDSLPRNFDVVVEDSLVASRKLDAHATSTIVEIAVPFALTRGKTNIAVVVRARGGTTPALRELRTIQEHNEVDPLSHFLQNHSGVAR